MLPSFRLVLATFVCGFVVVLLSLRLLDSVHIVRAPIPIPPSSAIATAEWRPPEVPVVFDLRFAATPGTALLVPASLTSSTAASPEPVAIAPPAPDQALAAPPEIEPKPAVIDPPVPRAEPAPEISAADPVNAAALEFATQAEFDRGPSAKRATAKPAHHTPTRTARQQRRPPANGPPNDSTFWFGNPAMR